MPRVRRGPNGPVSGAGGVGATNVSTPHKGAGTSGQSHESYMVNKDGKGFYGGGPKSGGGKGYKS